MPSKRNVSINAVVWSWYTKLAISPWFISSRLRFADELFQVVPTSGCKKGAKNDPLSYPKLNLDFPPYDNNAQALQWLKRNNMSNQVCVH